MSHEKTNRPDENANVEVDTETTQGKDVDADTVSDPSLDAPVDPAEADRDDDLSGADWSSEGGATREGPATHPGAARDQ